MTETLNDHNRLVEVDIMFVQNLLHKNPVTMHIMIQATQCFLISNNFTKSRLMRTQSQQDMQCQVSYEIMDNNIWWNNNYCFITYTTPGLQLE